MGMDLGPKTIAQYEKILTHSKTILWNGPLGVFEWPAFSQGSLAIAKIISQNHGYTMVAGGDSLSLLHQSGTQSQISHVSTGGGATLEFLEGRTLPGFKALEQK